MAEAADDVIVRLAAAVAGRYAVERELGAGGMATVYLAKDLRHGRQVAIKVLDPELGAMLGPGRFLREIEVAAGLTHPNILPLFDSGEGGGLLYYVMPYIEGESLDDKLRREIQLPVAEALAITRQVADALTYAHAHGVIHRDIKPANIMLSGANALVADFGIARAIGVTGGTSLTQSGMALGTPMYMSPEQAMASGTIDGRSDVYSLGCVLYEMLIGAPPFSGPTPMVVLARHSYEAVSGLRHIRQTVPEGVEFAIMKAMAKTPADRFATAADFARALDAPAPPRASSSVLTSDVPIQVSRRWATGVVAVLIVAVAVAALWFGGNRGAVPDPNSVAIIPFRGGAAGQPGGPVAQGFSDLLALRFSGEGGPRAVYPGTVTAAIARVRPANADELSLDEAVQAARAAGAGLVLLGQAYRNGNRVVAAASLVQVPGGAVAARVDEVSAPAESLPVLADRVTAELLARSAGESGERLRALLTTNLPALRAYLGANADLRRGAYTAAARKFGASLDADTSFTLAALGLISTGAYLSTRQANRGYALALLGRDRLGPGDRLLLRAAAGPRNQGPGRELASSSAEQVQAWEDAAAALPERAEVSFGLGDVLFHRGPQLGLANLHQRTSAAFRRALELNPSHVPALGHLIDLSAARGDTDVVRLLAPRYLALDSVGELADYYRWRVAVALAGTRTLDVLRRRFDSLSTATLERIAAVTQLDGVALEDARRAVDALRRKTGPDVAIATSRRAREIALNAGRPAEAAGIMREHMGSEPMTPSLRHIMVIYALHWGGDSAAAARQVAERSAVVDAAPIRRDANPADPVFLDVCSVGLWRLAHGETRGVARMITLLRSARAPMDLYATGFIGVCAALLEARLAHALSSPDAAQRLGSLDSLMRTGPPSTTYILSAANLAVAEMMEARGNLPGALAAVRRRITVMDLGENRVLVALSTFLREEGRLAALTGDRAGAIGAYEHYLALRSDPEAVVRPEVERVRAELTKLR